MGTITTTTITITKTIRTITTRISIMMKFEHEHEHGQHGHGEGFRDPDKNKNSLITVLCHLLTLYFVKQSSECSKRVLCEANNLSDQSDISQVLQRTVSIAAGMMMDDFLNNLSVGEVLEAVNSKNCH